MSYLYSLNFSVAAENGYYADMLPVFQDYWLVVKAGASPFSLSGIDLTASGFGLGSVICELHWGATAGTLRAGNPVPTPLTAGASAATATATLQAFASNENFDGEAGELAASWFASPEKPGLEPRWGNLTLATGESVALRVYNQGFLGTAALANLWFQEG